MIRRRIEIPEDSRFFAGHFPGHPILPGIAHLALVAEALGDPPLAEVKTLKLRKPVGPGDVLDLELDEGRFELRRGDETVSNGAVRIGGDGMSFEAAVPTPSSYPPPGELVPHAPPALLVSSMLEISAEGATAILRIPEGNPFVDSGGAGRAPAFVGLEAGAQTAAVLEALGREGTAGPRIGYVVAIRNARFRTPWLPAGVPLEVRVKAAGSAPPLSIYEVSLGGGLVTGLVSTYIAPTPTAS